MIKKGQAKKLELGNLDAVRDWGHAKDYVRAMHLIINHSVADDFIVATGQSHTVREMTDHVFTRLGMDYREYVTLNPNFLRPEELSYLRGDTSKLNSTFDWKPEYTFHQMMDEMVDHWMEKL